MLYFDDSQEDRDTYSERLNATGLVHVKAGPPPSDLNLVEISSFSPDVILIDYELTSDRHVNYKGATLGSAIREVVNNIPLILLTRRSLFGGDYQQVLNKFPVFSDYWDKGDVDSNPRSIAQRLVNIAGNYMRLIESEKNTIGLLQLLGVAGDEAALIKEAVPPLINGTWEEEDLAKWVKNTLFKFPGILYSALHSATFLGVSEEAFLSEGVQAFFTGTEYAGVFSDQGPYWWKDRVLSRALELTTKYSFNGTLNKTFSVAYEKEFGESLRPSVCLVSGEYPADAVCYIYDKPVMVKYSFLYKPDSRPSIMEEARVSLKAIGESNQFEEDFLEQGSEDAIRILTARFYESE